jgi:ammonia channel protein AmtB
MAQLTSAIGLVLWCSLATVLFFVIVKRTIGLRSKEADELAGLDLPEMGALAYPDFLLHRTDAGHVSSGPPGASVGLGAGVGTEK